MEALFVIAVLVVCVDLTAVIPQPVRVWRLKTTEGVSASTHAIGIAVFSAWCLYAVLRHDGPQLIANSIAIVSYSAVLLAMIRYGSLSPCLRAVAMMVGWCALLLGIDFALGTNGIAVVTSSLSMIRRLPQAVLAWRKPGGIGLSVASVTLTTAASFTWTTYGFLLSDYAVIVTSIWAIGVNSFIIVRTVNGRRAIRPVDEQLLARARFV